MIRSAKLAARLARLAGDGGEAPIRSPEAVAEALAGIARTTARAASVLRGADARVDPIEEGASAGSAGAVAREERLRIVGEGIRAWVELARQIGVDPEQALRLEDDRATEAARRDLHQATPARHR